MCMYVYIYMYIYTYVYMSYIQYVCTRIAKHTQTHTHTSAMKSHLQALEQIHGEAAEHQPASG